MTKRFVLDIPRCDDSDAAVASALTASLAGQAVAKPNARPPGTLASLDPATQSFIIDILNSNGLATVLQLIFVYFMSRKATRVKVGDVVCDLENVSDPKALANDTAERLTKP